MTCHALRKKSFFVGPKLNLFAFLHFSLFKFNPKLYFLITKWQPETLKIIPETFGKCGVEVSVFGLGPKGQRLESFHWLWGLEMEIFYFHFQPETLKMDHEMDPKHLKWNPKLPKSSTSWPETFQMEHVFNRNFQNNIRESTRNFQNRTRNFQNNIRNFQGQFLLFSCILSYFESFDLSRYLQKKFFLSVAKLI